MVYLNVFHWDLTSTGDKPDFPAILMTPCGGAAPLGGGVRVEGGGSAPGGRPADRAPTVRPSAARGQTIADWYTIPPISPAPINSSHV